MSSIKPVTILKNWIELKYKIDFYFLVFGSFEVVKHHDRYLFDMQVGQMGCVLANLYLICQTLIDKIQLPLDKLTLIEQFINEKLQSSHVSMYKTST